jgi:hypothetical protein
MNIASRPMTGGIHHGSHGRCRNVTRCGAGSDSTPTARCVMSI